MSPILPGSFLLDYSYARPDLPTAYASGARGFLRYSAGAASLPDNPSHSQNHNKLITPAEFDRIIGSGGDVVANSEWYTTRVTEGVVLADGEVDVDVRGLEVLFLRAAVTLSRGGGQDGSQRYSPDDLIAFMADAGTTDGPADAQLWGSCGYNHGASIYVSWDAYPNPAKYAAVAAYLKNHDTALQGHWHTDLYAGTPALREMFRRNLIRYGWRPNAPSWSNDHLPYQPDTSTVAKRQALVQQALLRTPAGIWQTGNYWFSKTADENLVVRAPFGSHLQNAPKPVPPPVPPTPPAKLKEIEMLVYVVDPKTVPSGTTYPGIYCLSGSRFFHVATHADQDEFRKAGVPFVDVTYTTWVNTKNGLK